MPPGSLDFTYFMRFVVSRSTGDGAATEEAVTTNLGALTVLDHRRGVDWGNERARGFWEVCEEKEREANDEVRKEIEIAIFVELV